METSLVFLLLINIVTIVHSEPLKVDHTLSYVKVCGYIQCDGKSCSNIVLPKTLQDFENFSGLAVSGVLEDEIEELMSRPRRAVTGKSLKIDGTFSIMPG
jgi:hypothetical protein